VYVLNPEHITDATTSEKRLVYWKELKAEEE
jgi:hypothetical protein